MLPTYVAVQFSLSILVFRCLRNVCFIVIFIECFKLLVSPKKNVCVCVRACMGACVRACVRVCVRVYIVIVKYFPFVFERFLATGLIELLMSYCKMY